jgi:phospho-N-acetylmuramoyl-pentapeptide-transferase
MTINAIKLLIPSILTFSFAILLAPFLINFLQKNSLWKNKSVQKTIDGKEATITQKLHNDEVKKTPRMGGIIIWTSTTIVALFVWILSIKLNIIPEKLDFISRNQTWLILFGMIFAGILGALDDISSCGKKVPLIGKSGLSFLWRLFVVFLLSLFIGFWFYFKLNFTELFIPFYGMFDVGIFIFFFISFFTIMMFSVSNIDGIDGLSGGLFAIAFASFGIIAISQNQIDIAAFCFSVVGGCFGFLWFNISPAKFYNSETGILSLTISLTLVAFLTNQLIPLIIITLPLLSAPMSAIIQLLSKKFLKRKFFLVAPIHHHFQAKGMENGSVVMRYWIIGLICSFLGIIISLAGAL